MVNECKATQINSGFQNLTNPVNFPNTKVIQVFDYNSDRKMIILQNVGTVAIVVKYGSPPNLVNNDFHFVLQPCGVANDGTGGVLVDEIWNGSVFVQPAASGAVATFLEMI